MAKQRYWQQGDVVLFEIDEYEIPKDAVEVQDPVLQHGEATGHAHRLHGGGFLVFETPTKQKFLRLVQSVPLRHEEHKEIKLPAGNYRLGIVREYDHFSEEARQVTD